LRRQVSVVVTASQKYQCGTGSQGGDSDVPIVFQIGTDPVQVGLVNSLNRPRAISPNHVVEQRALPKRLELMRDVLPAAKSFGVLANPANAGALNQSRGLRRGPTFRAGASSLQCEHDRELAAAIAKVAELRLGAPCDQQ